MWLLIETRIKYGQSKTWKGKKYMHTCMLFLGPSILICLMSQAKSEERKNTEHVKESVCLN